MKWLALVLVIFSLAAATHATPATVTPVAAEQGVVPKSQPVVVYMHMFFNDGIEDRNLKYLPKSFTSEKECTDWIASDDGKAVIAESKEWLKEAFEGHADVDNAKFVCVSHL